MNKLRFVRQFISELSPIRKDQFYLNLFFEKEQEEHFIMHNIGRKMYVSGWVIDKTPGVNHNGYNNLLIELVYD